MKLLLLALLGVAAHPHCNTTTATPIALAECNTTTTAPSAPSFASLHLYEGFVNACVHLVLHQHITQANCTLCALLTMVAIVLTPLCRRHKHTVVRFPAISDHVALYIPDALFMNASFVLANMSRGKMDFVDKSFPSEEGMGRMYTRMLEQHPKWNHIDWQRSLFVHHLQQGRMCILVEAEDPHYYRGFTANLSVHAATSGLAKAVILVPKPWTIVARCDGQGTVCDCVGRPYLWVVVKHTLTHETRFVMGAHFPNTNCAPDKAMGFDDDTQEAKIRSWFASTVQMDRRTNGTYAVQIASRSFNVDDCIFGCDANDDHCQDGAIVGTLRTNAVNNMGPVLGAALAAQPPLVTGCALAKNGQFNYCGSWLCSAKTPQVPQYATHLPPPIYKGPDHYRFEKTNLIDFGNPSTFLSKVKPVYWADTMEKVFDAYALDCGWTKDNLRALEEQCVLVAKT